MSRAQGTTLVGRTVKLSLLIARLVRSHLCNLGDGSICDCVKGHDRLISLDICQLYTWESTKLEPFQEKMYGQPTIRNRGNNTALMGYRTNGNETPQRKTPPISQIRRCAPQTNSIAPRISLKIILTPFLICK